MPMQIAEYTSALGPACVKTQIKDIFKVISISFIFKSRSRYFELADSVYTDSIL